MERVFEPWIGDTYNSGGLHGCKVFILGESHYGGPAAQRLNFTNYVIERYAIAERRRFFTVVQRLVSLDSGRGRYSAASKRSFWNSISFCNYVQAIVGPKARNRPTPSMWRTGADVLLQVLEEVKPDVVVVLGKELRRHLPAFPSSVEVAYITHPSGRGMRYSQCQPLIRAAMERSITSRAPAHNG